MLGGMLDVLERWLHFLWPFRVVTCYEGGVAFWGGHPGIELRPDSGLFGRRWTPKWLRGIFGFIPFFSRIEVLPLCEDVVDLPVQSVTTSDGKTVTFSANIAYIITDPVAHYTNVQDFADSFSRAACGHLAKRVREWTWDELHQKQKDLESSLKDTMTTRVKNWGVRVLEVRLTDCSLSRQYRLFQ